MKKSCCKSRMSAKGFTLIEVLVVVLIIAVLAAVAVPQYQKAVLKSRFSSLLPTTKAIRDGNEAYYLTHSGYASAANQLDVTATNNENMTFELSRDLDYSYVLATRPDLNEKNNLIMYQKHSAQFPGEIHCEALADDTQAEWLCQTGMHATQNLGEVITEGYNTYVLEGTGNGLTPAQMAAANGPSCDTAYAAGATNCHITEATENSPKTKEVCYSIRGSNDYCVYTTFDENNKRTVRTSCTAQWCTETKYNSEGHITQTGHCRNKGEDGKSCLSYYQVDEYEYNGDTRTIKVCSGNQVEENQCSSYTSVTKQKYENGKISKSQVCNRTDIACTSPYLISEYEYENGRVSKQQVCSGTFISGESCSSYNSITVYEYDGNNVIEKSCSQINGKNCNQYENSYMIQQSYDENGEGISWAGYSWNGEEWEEDEWGVGSYY